MKIIRNVMLGLLLVCSSTLFFAPGLYAAEENSKAKAQPDRKLEDLRERYLDQLIKDALKDKNPKIACQYLLRDAIKDDNLRLVTKLMYHVQDIDHTLLVASINSKVVELLLTHKADPNIRNFHGYTPLKTHMSVVYFYRENAIDCIELLLAHNAHVNAQDDKGHTALYTLIQSNYYTSNLKTVFPVVTKLLDHRADPYIGKNDTGKTIPELLNNDFLSLNEKDKDLMRKTIAACTARRTEDLHEALRPYTFKNLANMIIDYTWEDYEREALPKRTLPEVTPDEEED